MTNSLFDYLTHNRGVRLLILSTFVLIAGILRFYRLGYESLWFDEAFSVNVADWDPRWIILKLTEIGLRSTDRNVFNLMLHYALLLGRSEVTVRAIPAISGVLSVIAIYALGKRLFSTAVGLFAALLLSISPMSIWFSREGRAYSVLELFGILAAYFMMRALMDNSIQAWLGYTVLAALGVYTHSFGALIIVALNLFALMYIAARRAARPTIQRWFLTQALLAIILFPFLRSFATQSSSGWGAWIADKYGVPTVKHLATTMGMFSFGTAYDRNHTPYVLALAVFAVPCLKALLSAALRFRDAAWRQREGVSLSFSLLYLIVPIGVLFLASQVTPLYLERYLLPFVPPYLLIVSYGVMAMARLHWRLLLIAAILVVTIPAVLSVYQPGQKEDWRTAAAHLTKADAQAGDLIVFYDAYTSIPFNFYYSGKGQQLLISRFALDDELLRHAREIARAPRRVWLVLSHADEKRLTNLIESQPGVYRRAEQSFFGLSIVEYEVQPLP